MPESEQQTTPATEEPKKVNGGRNLIILGVFAIFVALVTTSFSLWVYRQNDIYLDRSRPGFISEGEKSEEESIEKFSEDGEITVDVLDKYLEELDYVKGKINDLSEAFAPGPLDDKNFLFDENEDEAGDLDSEDAS